MTHRTIIKSSEKTTKKFLNIIIDKHNNNDSANKIDKTLNTNYELKTFLEQLLSSLSNSELESLTSFN
ncbi:MAG: hypothetical protein ACRCX7_14810 [Cetobacterium sp.]|uniref:hypothetical protein n=1 Tax=Cetobacterium sp. TaxID=2071632 RepID=UPI003F2C1DE8